MSTIKRPIQIEEFKLALREITDSQLYNAKAELTKSVDKLGRTNFKLEKLSVGETLKSHPDDSDSDDDLYNEVDENDSELFLEIIRENEVVIKNQRERIESIDGELAHRGLPLVEGSPIYGENIEEQSSKIPKPSSRPFEKESGVNTDNTDTNNSVYL
ncbi:hypothetical protein WICMUC_002998 [Wickerhamomyces mucosus]|uniref:Uncharacterized protein n=1 Tax=Wickerhamomyces mucosus TaxID=1378264 RepID=A0A9P8TDR7_9ASCO|nr:hypothetical protein WICMUC_002998 [Wickerhamomyces mucosus]